MTYIKLFLVTLPVFALLDFLWLGIIAKNFYLKNIGFIIRLKDGQMDPNWIATFLVYIVLVLGVAVFVLPKFAGSPIDFKVFLYGALFGLVVYGVYDLTNLALVKNWPVNVVVVDIVWGMFVYGLTSLLAGLFARFLKLI